jgi:hypothetical protein
VKVLGVKGRGSGIATASGATRALRRMCFGVKGAVSSTQCVLTLDTGPDTCKFRPVDNIVGVTSIPFVAQTK